MKIKEYNFKRAIVLVVLAALAFIFAINDIEFLYGIVFNFASIFLLLIIYLFGGRKACLISISIYLINLLFFNGSILNIIFVFEIIFIAKLKNIKLNLILKDLLFWGIGSIIIYIFCSFINIEQSKELIGYYILNVVVNSLINAFIVDVIITYLPLKNIKKENNNYKKEIPFNTFLLHSCFLAIIVPFVTNLSVSSSERIQSIVLNSQKRIDNVIYNVEDTINNFSKEDKLRLQLFGTIQLGMLENSLQKSLNSNYIYTTIVDKDNRVIASNKENIQSKDKYILLENSISKTLDDGIYQKLEMNKNKPYMFRWVESYIVKETTINELDFKILVEYPLLKEKESIKIDYGNLVRFILFISVCVSAIALLMNKVMINTILRLAQITTDLPKKLNNINDIEWPKSKILESKTLSDNFKSMAIKLNESQYSLEKMAYYDTLTKLPNRLNFNKYLKNAVADVKDTDKKIAVIFMDIDGFKQINDTLGHNEGDKLLQMISTRLKSLNKHGVMVFRLGGDEFVIVSISNTIKEIREVCNKILDEFKNSFELKGGAYEISSSLGVSVLPDHTTDITELIQNADMAMYKCKEKGGNYPQFFNEKIKETFVNKIEMEKGIRKALENNEFELFYQPKINVKNKKISSGEALIRWNNKSFGTIATDKFIEIAEETNLIIDIDKWVISEACKQSVIWQNENEIYLPVAVNISAKHFNNGNLYKTIKDALTITGLDPSYLKIEITEGVLINDVKSTTKVINSLKELGVSISIDDFGRGYSSLNQLINLQVSEVKIDRDFITNIFEDEKKQTIVKLIVELAHNLKLNVVAEGIEIDKELEFLYEINCDEIQGYIFSRPLPVNKFIEFIYNFV